MRKMLTWLGLALLAAPALAENIAEDGGKDLFARQRTPAQAQALLRDSMPDLGKVQVLRGTFRQRKVLREIPSALISSGEFLLVPGSGVWWHTVTPLESELTLATTHRSGPNAGAARTASTFLALFALDLETLSRDFDLFVIEPTAHRKQWQLGLRPRDATMTAWFGHAVISGGERVEQVILFEAAGDRTEIELAATAQPRSGLTPAERRRFEP